MDLIRVVVHGAHGKMGREVTRALCYEPGLMVVGAVEKQVTEEHLTLPDGSKSVPFSARLDSLLEDHHADVVVDFSVAQAALEAVRIATKRKVNLVIGTTGLSANDLNEIDRLSRENDVGAMVASNFALGAVLLMYLAKIASKFFDYAEIMEMHHHQKLDAPSGTAISTARAMLDARGKPFLHSQAQKETLKNVQGGEVDGIAIHSMRLPGLLAHQEVIFGGAGQTLSLRHDTISRECYMSGVILATREIVCRKGLVYGLDRLLGLG